MTVEVRSASEADLQSVAQLHLAAFPDSVLGKLGVEAVRRSYRWQLTGPHDITALVAVDRDRVVGYMFGGVFRGATIGFVKRERWFLLTRLLRHPTVVLNSVGRDRLRLAGRLLVRRPSSNAAAPATERQPSFGVLAIAVDPSSQGSGIGSRLMQAAVDEAQALGFNSMSLTVHPTNEGALHFYRSLGWVEDAESDGSWNGRMTFVLAK